MLNAFIWDADSSLFDAIGYVKTVKFIVRALEPSTRGAEVDGALHSMQLAADNAASLIATAREKLEAMDALVPVDNSNNGDKSGENT